MLQFVTNRDIYRTLICEQIPRTRQVLWLATADLKDLYVDKHRKMVPFLEVLADLVRKRVEIRLLHAKRPGPVFWRDYNRFPILDEGMEMMLCPRVHLKCAIIDHKIAYSGSANFTGAGVGAKGEHKRNFESGFLTDERDLVNQMADQFDAIWRGDFCKKCQRKVYCSAKEDVLNTP
jgi:phosphatidylserine/phosphatidylglycerophosphate/cardiolipin synthase-like enzyme